jgi:hypothetical protein
VAVLKKAQVESLAIGLPEKPGVSVSAPLLAAALRPLDGIDVAMFGPLGEMSRVLPDLAR